MEETSVNYEFDEETDTIAIYGGYGIINYRGEDRNIVSVRHEKCKTYFSTVSVSFVYMSTEMEASQRMTSSKSSLKQISLSHHLDLVLIVNN